MKYGQSITWTEKDGSKITASVCGAPTLLQAQREAVDLAKTYGWRPYRWWEFWRWGNTKIHRYDG